MKSRDLSSFAPVFLGIAVLIGCQPAQANSKPTQTTVTQAVSKELVPRRVLQLRYEMSAASGKSERALGEALRKSSAVLWSPTADGGFVPHSAPPIPVRKRIRTDLAVFGGEIEAVTTAMAAAKRGMEVVLVTDGPLGGLCADTGGNLRYFDGMPGMTRTAAQYELYAGIGVLGNVAIPRDTDARINAFLRRRYPAIRVVRIQNMSLTQPSVKRTVESVVTDGGVEIRADRYLDMDPECRFGEVCGLRGSVKTPALDYGLVFGIEGLSRRDLSALRSASLTRPESILGLVGVSRGKLKRIPGANEALYMLNRVRSRDFIRTGGAYSYGYRGLAQGYQVFMLAREAKRPSEALRTLNSHRQMSGYNVSHLGSEAVLNGMSYNWPETLLQNAHSLSRDPKWRALVQEERRGLAAYFRAITGNPNLQIQIPDQFYVRRSTAYFAPVFPYKTDHFRGPLRSRWRMAYGMDLRGLRARPGYDDDLIAEIAEVHDLYIKQWDCRPEVAITRIPNLYALNKCVMTPRFSGGLRILQNMITTGQALVETW